MDIECITGDAGLSSLGNRWAGMLQQSGVANAFLDWEWLTLWREYVGKPVKPLFLCGSLPGQGMVACAPLVLRRRMMYGISLNSVEFCGSGEVTPDHLGFICPPQLRGEFTRLVFRWLAARRREWDILRLTDMADDPVTAAAARETFGFRLPAYSRKGVCPYITLPSSWQEYTRTLTSGRRQRIGKYERDLRRDFNVCFSLCEKEDELVRLMGILEKLYVSRMRAKNPRSPALHHWFWEFQRKFALRMLAAERLFTGSLRLDGRTAACMYGFISGSAACFYISAIDADFERYSVGFVNIVNMIREAIGKGLQEIDFLRGEEPYKSYFAKSARDNTELVIWNATPRSALVNAVELPLSLTKKTLKWARSTFST